MSASQLNTDLRAIRTLLSDPAKWTKGENARDHEGCGVTFNHPAATCWCLNGANAKLHARQHWSRFHAVDKALTAAATEPGSYLTLNDNGTHPGVMAFLDKVIEANP
ncbi:hypothetical protein QBC99_002470 [Beijerinckia sp. GAS462]|nr:hypothetical protein [Beijerinckia sp. GAS462]SEC43793.1 hypothetical protein SAMN05443249_2689 [Beijerinckia sp. 28-YEA-48]